MCRKGRNLGGGLTLKDGALLGGVAYGEHRMKARWGLAAAAVAIPAALWMAPVAIGGDRTSSSTSGGAQTGHSARVVDPLALWAQRSPGVRALGALLNSKPGSGPIAGSGGPPTQRVLPTIRDRPRPGPIAGGEPAGPTGPTGSPPEPLPPPPGFLPGAPILPEPVGAPPWYPDGPGFTGGSGGGLGGPFPSFPPVGPGTPDVPLAPDVPMTPDVPLAPDGPGGPDGPVVPGVPVAPVTPVVPGGPGDWPTSPPIPPFPPSAVPEPGTWLMMILGFFAIGISIRRARGRRAEV